MAEKKRKPNGVLRALKVVLEHVDWTNGKRHPGAMISSILPTGIIEMAREEIAKAEAELGAGKGEPEYIDAEDGEYRYE